MTPFWCQFNCELSGFWNSLLRSLFLPLPKKPTWGFLIELGMPRNPDGLPSYRFISQNDLTWDHVSVIFSSSVRHIPLIFQVYFSNKGTFPPQFRTHGMPGASRQRGPRGGVWWDWSQGKPSINGAFSGDVTRRFMGYVWEIDQYLLAIYNLVETHHFQ